MNQYPEGKKFAVCLTHDVDLVHFFQVSRVAKALLKGQINETWRVLLSKINKKFNPWWNFEDIMTLEKKYRAKSSFYFLVLDKDELDFNFKIEDLKHEIENIASKNTIKS